MCNTSCKLKAKESKNRWCIW